MRALIESLRLDEFSVFVGSGAGAGFAKSVLVWAPKGQADALRKRLKAGSWFITSEKDFGSKIQFSVGLDTDSGTGADVVAMAKKLDGGKVEVT